MRRSNKLLAFLLSLVVFLSFAGCSADIYDQSQIETTSSVIENSLPSGDIVQNDSQNPTEDPTEISDDETAVPVDPTTIPAYSGSPYVVINDNQPQFSSAELTTAAYESYADLDSYGRCGMAIASCGTEIMPRDGEERGSISSIYPSGWEQAKYSGISGGYLWNRCHLIGWQLSAENANRQNLITGTRYMNTEGMLPFENMVADYIQETGYYVAYRVTPVFEGSNLVCSGVQMEAYSIEDDGEGICFNVYCYNVQPGISIDYATGKSTGPANETVSTPNESIAVEEEQVQSGEMVWIPRTGSKYHNNPNCSNMKNPSQVTLQEAIDQGYEPCKKCY